ncbi:MAG: glycogen synthase GlgA [Deltaproteobacteria bacterium]|nr:glycogen synthase GlgA [Deltaproteobacteria bacterium]
MRVLHVSSEVAPFAQSGGLADVVAGLPAAQAALGSDAAVCVPLYRGVREKLEQVGIALDEGFALPLELGSWSLTADIRLAQVGRVRYAFVDIPALFDRPGGLYGPGGASEHVDNHMRFGALGKAAVMAGPKLFGASLDVMHVHDWQGGPAAVFARAAEQRAHSVPSTIVATIHNLAYRGIFPKSVIADLGIPWSMFNVKQLEFYDQVSFLKGALGLADAVTTVSPTYAQEILTPERGEVLDGFLRWDVKRLVGIVNGIDTLFWDPANDKAIAHPFSRAAPKGKAACRAALAEEAKLPLHDREPLIGVIARMTGQKGLDLVADIVPWLATISGNVGARLVVLGAGEPEYEERFRWLARTFDKHVSTTIGFDIGFARRIYAGADLFLMPSRFEPCGLGQLYAMRYGTIPIVHAVGGLRDTVSDPGNAELAKGRGTGIRFDTASPEALAHAIWRGTQLFGDRTAFAKLRDAAMARDSSWMVSAHEYVQLYRSLRP